MTEKAYSFNGRVWYVGTGFTEALVTAFLEQAQVDQPYAELIDCPAETELVVRSNGITDWFFVLNYTKQPQQIRVSPALTALIGEGSTLPPLSCFVWTKKR